jgi:hypothetical protein
MFILKNPLKKRELKKRLVKKIFPRKILYIDYISVSFHL